MMTTRHQIRVASLVVTFTVTAASPSWSQQTPALGGAVLDPTGAAIAGARVELVSGPTPGATTSDSSGRYGFEGLTPGHYSVRVTAQGFQSAERKVTVSASQATTLDVRMTLQSVTEEVEVVAAAGYARSASDLPVSATVVTRERALASPERSVDGLLRHVASVQLQNDDADAVFPLQPSMAMRGLGVGDTADRGLVLVDGLPLNSGFFGNVAWNRAPKRAIERIEVVRGASSSLFGSFAMGGVVDVITRIPDKRETTADFQFGQYQRVQANVNHADVIGSQAAFSVNANVLDTDGYYQVPEEDRRPIDEPQASRLANVQGRFDAGLSDRVRGFAKAGYNDQSQSGGYQLAGTDTDVFDVAGGVDADLQQHGALGLRVMYANEYFDIRNVRIVDDVTTFVANPHIAESDDFGLSVRWSKALAGVFAQLTTGADFRRIDGYDQQEVLNTPGQLNARILGAGVQTSVGAFVQASLRPSEWSEILAGVRLDRFSNSNGRIVTNDAAVAYDDRSFTIASPRVAGRAQITSNLGLRGAWFGGFRAPTLAELYRSFESPTFRGLSSPDLQEERLQGGDGGIEFRYERLAGQVNGFYNRLEDFVGSAEVGFVDGKFTVRATNVAAVRSRGLEAMATVRVSDFVTVDGSYTFTDATVVEGELEGNDVEGAPRHAYSLVGTYLAPRTTITVKARFVDDSSQDISNEAPQDAHFIVDLLTAQRVHRHIEIFVAGENVFDDQYVADGFGPTLGAPRQFSVGLRVSF